MKWLSLTLNYTAIIAPAMRQHTAQQPGTACQLLYAGSPLGDWETLLDIVLELLGRFPIFSWRVAVNRTAADLHHYQFNYLAAVMRRVMTPSQHCRLAPGHSRTNIYSIQYTPCLDMACVEVCCNVVSWWRAEESRITPPICSAAVSVVRWLVLSRCCPVQ